MKKNNGLRRIVIVGGGSSGWISASCLAYSLQNSQCEITLVESPDIGIIGVGEATIPSFVDFIQYLGLSKADFIRETKATFKLGIKFYDWLEEGHEYWHQFGDVGVKIDGKPYYQHWLKSKFKGAESNYTDYSPSIAMAQENKFSFRLISKNLYCRGPHMRGILMRGLWPMSLPIMQSRLASVIFAIML